MVDERRVRLLLQRVEDDLRFLAVRRGLERQVLLADEDRLAAVKYHLLTSIAGCLAVAQHLCAAEGWGPPTSNADAMNLLGARGVLVPAHAARMAAAVRFRNVLVHEYVRVDDERVVAYLDELQDLEVFVAGVVAFLAR